MSTLKPAITSEDHHLGNSRAAITLVEFGDFECPHCGRAHPLVQRLLKEMGESLHFVFRNFPLQQSHPHAYMAAAAAEAAGKQNAYWQMHDLIFENQSRLSGELFVDLATSLQLNVAQFGEDWKSEPVQAKIEGDFESGVRSGVNGTPTFFLNGKQLLTYDESYASLRNAILLDAEHH